MYGTMGVLRPLTSNCIVYHTTRSLLLFIVCSAVTLAFVLAVLQPLAPSNASVATTVISLTVCVILVFGICEYGVSFNSAVDSNSK
jgi:glycerol uptake facilitator-like aquaporin